MVQNAAGVELTPQLAGGTATPDPATWIPNPGQIFYTKVAILQTVVATLSAYGLMEDYEDRIVLAHGEAPQVQPESAQVIISCLGIFPGKAGQQQFQFQSGSPGLQLQRFGRFRLMVLNVWESIQGESYTPSLPDVETMAVQSNKIDVAGWTVLAGLVALSQGGITPSIPQSPVPGIDNLLVASMAPYGPEGKTAGWVYTLEQQLTG